MSSSLCTVKWNSSEPLDIVTICRPEPHDQSTAVRIFPGTALICGEYMCGLVAAQENSAAMHTKISRSRSDLSRPVTRICDRDVREKRGKRE